jgi:glycosyltransferase involved in cell wall biosynthesis
MLEAYAAWRGSRDVHVIAAGGGDWTDQERRRLVELRVADRVQVEPRVDDTALAVLYNRATLLVHPSGYEGFGLTVLEALACGCPVVASRIPATLEVAADCAIYFEPSDPLSLASALDRALTEGRQSPRASAGVRRAQSFSWDQTARTTLQLFRELR